MSYLFLLLMSDAYARTIESTAKNLGVKAQGLAMALVMPALLLVGAYYLMGSPDAKIKLNGVIVGIIIILTASAIVTWFKGAIG